MIDKRVLNPAEAVSDIADGSSIMIGGFGEAVFSDRKSVV